MSDTLIPLTIVQRMPKKDMGKKNIYFVSHTMVHINRMKIKNCRVVPEISLKASNNSGGYYFYEYIYGGKMHRYNWKELPIPEEVIEQVGQLYGDQGGPIMGYGYPFSE